MRQIWWGKLAGGVLGLVAGGWLGALIGVLIGHQIDVGLSRELTRQRSGSARADTRSVQFEFFTTTFSVMGHLAKADGRVSEGEIKTARVIMHRMSLSPEQVKSAIKLFNEGKRPGFPLQAVLRQFKRVCRRHRDLMRTFLEIQLQAALADGNIHQDKRRVLWELCSELGFSRVELAQLEALARLYSVGRNAQTTPAADRLKEAYRVLGVGHDASDAAVKKAYRRLMNQHHPDKLLSKGLPEEMMQLAREKTHEIRAAYDLVKEARGMR